MKKTEPRTLQDLQRKLLLKQRPDAHQEIAKKVWNDQRLYHPGCDGEYFVWRLLLDEGPMTQEEIEQRATTTTAAIGGVDYVRDCFSDMVHDGAVVPVGRRYQIDPELLVEMKRRQAIEDAKPVYYCEQCFHVRAAVVMMHSTPDGLVCPNCRSAWKLNRGQARHIVSLKLRHYRRLAERLGIPTDE